MKVGHLIGNGQSAHFYKPAAGIKITCNLPPFPVDNAFATVMVDFKMMRAIQDGSLIVPGDWILGYRPKLFCGKHSDFYMRYAPQIREFYTKLPEYTPNYTDLSCGHMACHYMAMRHNPDVINMYGFDSIFDFDMRSCSDFYLQSTRDATNTARLAKNWRAIWPPMFEEFSSTKFVLHHNHDKPKIKLPGNCEIKVHNKKK